jgi:hypothetical protein
VQMWQNKTQSRCRCGGAEPTPGADVAEPSPLPVQMWRSRAHSRCRCGGAEPSRGADVALTACASVVAEPTECPRRPRAVTGASDFMCVKE